MVGSLVDEWPFIGRDAEIDTLLAGIDGSGAVVFGQAGVGKTRLITEVTARIDPDGYAVFRVFGTAASQNIPLGAFATLLPATEPDRHPLHDAVTALRDTADGRRLVLMADDANLLDQTSAALVEQLILHEGASALLSVRTGEPRGYVERLAHGADLVRMDLETLDETDAGDVVEGALGDRVERAALQRVWQVTRGNPLWIREVVIAGLDTGTLALDSRVWRWRGTLGIGQRLADAITSQLGRLTGSERDVLELLAFGEPMGADLLAEFAEHQVLEALEARGLVSVRPQGRRTEVWLGHPLYAEALRAQCEAARANRRRQELARAIQSYGARRHGDVLRVATWLLESDAAAPTDLLITAARDAWAALDVRLAERLARKAMDAGGGLRAIETLAASLTFGVLPEQSEELLAGLTATATLAERAVLDNLRAFNLMFGLARHREAGEVVAAALEEVTGEGRAQLRTAGASISLYRLHLDEAMPDLDHILGSTTLTDSVRRQAVLHQTRALTAAGRHHSARDLSDEHRWLYDVPSVYPPWTRPGTALARTDIALLDLDAAVAEEGARRVLETDLEWEFSRPVLYSKRAHAARLGGRIGDALHWASVGAAVARARHTVLFDDCCFAELAHAQALLGQVAEATSALAEAEERGREAWLLGSVWTDIARPWVHAAGGELGLARETALRTAARLGELGALNFEALALHDAVRLGAAVDAHARLQVLATQVEGSVVGLYAAHATACVEANPAGLEKVAGEFERRSALLLAAEALSQAAESHGLAGNAREQRLMHGRATWLAGRCQGAVIASLASVDDVELTPRQREVARLAASGLGNREIAERMVLSRRTVENHMYVIYTKLGVSNRAELAERLSPGTQ